MAGKEEKNGFDVFDDITSNRFGNFNTDGQVIPKTETVYTDISQEIQNFETEEEEEEENQEEQEENQQQEEEDDEESPFTIFAQNLLSSDTVEIELDDEGNPLKEYEASEEGLKEIIEDTIDKKVNDRFVQFENDLQEIEVYPGLSAKDFLDYVQNGGNPRDFVDLVSNTDYTEVDTSDEDNQRYLIEDKLKLDGLSSEEIEEILQDYIDSGSLEKHAKIAHKFLVKNQELKQQELIKNQEKAKKQQELQDQEDFEEFKEQVLNVDKTLGISMSEKEKKGFLEYLTKPINKSGSTQYQIDSDNSKRLEAAYFTFKGGLKNIEKKVETKESKKLLDALTRSSDKNTMGSNNYQPEQERQKKNSLPDLKGFTFL